MRLLPRSPCALGSFSTPAAAAPVRRHAVRNVDRVGRRWGASDRRARPRLQDLQGHLVRAPPPTLNSAVLSLKVLLLLGVLAQCPEREEAGERRE